MSCSDACRVSSAVRMVSGSVVSRLTRIASSDLLNKVMHDASDPAVAVAIRITQMCLPIFMEMTFSL